MFSLPRTTGRPVLRGHSLRSLRFQHVRTSSASSAAVAGGDAFEAERPEVFPRINEKDPYKLLAVDKEAFPEEIIEAKNYLTQQFGSHEPSREAIEMAYEAIMMGDRWKLRKKRGMMRVNKKTGKVEAEGADPNLLTKFKALLEPSVPLPVIINKGTIYVFLTIWAVIQFRSTNGDCTLPLLINMAYCIYSVFDKRQQRNPEGPFMGGTPLWGALGACIISMLAGAGLAVLLQNLGLYPPHWDGALVGAALMMLANGVAAIWFR